MGLLQFFSTLRKTAPSVLAANHHADFTSQSSTATSPSLVDSLAYPPRDPGIPLVLPDQCLGQQDEIIRRLKVHAALPQEKFERRFLNPIHSIANYVSTLPASSDGIFSGPGGLFRSCIELAFASFQASDGRIFSINAGVEERHLLEGRWRYVCFLAGLIWPLGRTLEAIKVSAGPSATWTPRLEPIIEWAKAVNESNVFCSWPRTQVNPGPSMTGASIAIALAGKENLRWLEEGSPQLVTAFVGIAGGQREDRFGNAFDVVSEMWKRVISTEAARRPQSYGRLQFGSHLGPHLVDVMHGLLKDGKWSVGRTPVYADSKGIYLEWPSAAEDMLEHFIDKGLVGMPSSASGLLASFEDSGLVVLQPGASSPLIEIADDSGELRSGVKLSRPSMLMTDFEPSKFEGKRMIVVSDIVKADPLPKPKTKPKNLDANTSVVTSNEVVLSPPPPGPDLLSATLGDVHADVDSPLSAQAERSRPADIVDKTNAEPIADQLKEKSTSANPQPVNTRSEEPEEISYYDKVPSIWRNQVKRREGEVLGRLIEIWNDQSPSDQMCVQSEGCAIALTVLTELSSRHTDFLQEMQKIGMLHVNPTTPGRMVYDITSSDGVKRKNFFIVALYAAKQLGMKL